MSSIPIDNIEVAFPFSPYTVQVEYMQAVLRSLKGAHNALLESPTGTGKTMCLLCATLAWLEDWRAYCRSNGFNDPTLLRRVVYCSRTHAQLTQVIREFERTRYSSCFSMAVLGSRDHMCVNPQVVRLPSQHAQQKMCSTLREERNCRFFRGYQGYSDNKNSLMDEFWVHDMEDLVKEGQKCGLCPYFYERDKARDADIVFLPYNYVFDTSLRKQLPFELSGSILIVDEAHNLPSVLGAVSGMNLQPLDLTNAIHDCSRAMALRKVLMKAAEDSEEQCDLMDEQELAALKIILCDLETFIAGEPAQLPDGEDSKKYSHRVGGTGFVEGEIVRRGSYMIPFLKKASITRDMFFGEDNAKGGMNEVISKALTLLNQGETAGVGLSKVQQFLTFVFGQCLEVDDDEACFFIMTSGRGTGDRCSVRTLSYWCMDISRSIKGVVDSTHSLLLTSGTLSPLDHFAMELGIHFEVRLKGDHVIEQKQVVASVLCKGPGGERLNGSYAFRCGAGYRGAIGATLVNISTLTPGGMLVFFPSYVAMNAAVDLWRTGSGRVGETETIWAALVKNKPVFVEPGNAEDANTVLKSYQQEVDKDPTRGALLLAVCRGRTGEGVDFADHHGRCVVVVGIPFANCTDLLVRLKREYITRVATHRPKVDGKLFTGDEWYVNEAMRSVSQCIGRVIRHRNDYGAIVLADERFADRMNCLPKWVASRCTVHREFGGSYACVADFFKSFRRVKGGTTRPSTQFVDPAAPNRSSRETATGVNGTELPTEANVAGIPSSAEMAKNFAARADLEASSAKGDQVRKIFEKAAEMPVSISVSHKSLKTTPEEGVSDAQHTEAGEGASRPTFRKQVITQPQVSHNIASPPVDTIVGSTSGEFCKFLKQQLQPESYAKFKGILHRIAEMRTQCSLPSDDRKRILSSAFDDLAVLFREAAGERYMDLLSSFCQHIPEEFHLYYTYLIRKRKRTP
uniref:Putative helicase n=1 Tax=Trypanosoma congolense (strain IL3000) TaxID=1068625 RepID=G0UK65_TRYCI|nr:putative helicase [Trypanosoma congolense IL3000]